VIAKVNTDEDNEWAGRYNVSGIPTMFFMFNGNIVHRQVGALPEPYLRDVVDQFLEAVAESDAA
jgi:thioredoxin 1